MRGEHAEWDGLLKRVTGSSPHARGAPGFRDLVSVGARIIPACAGSTRPGPRMPEPLRDHPRMRGEHMPESTPSVLMPGSSPHARGALAACSASILYRRIIPACAGSTGSAAACSCPRGDHPCMRGEHTFEPAPTSCRPESSPRARGAPGLLVSHATGQGIIPACAGSTTYVRRCGSCKRDYPRMRGEHALTLGRKQAGAGSSPHARGALSGTRRARGRDGIIPACAGNTPHGGCSYSPVKGPGE